DAKYNGEDLGPKTVTLTTLPGIPELTKKVNKVDYTPGGKLIYTITLKNVGTGYLNDVSIIDELGSINTELADGTIGKAISGFTQVTLTKTNPLTVIAQDTTDPNRYKATGDIYPGDTVTVVIEATVNPLAAGKITNRAEIKDSLGNTITEDPKDNSTTVNPLPAIVQILKTVDKSIYVDQDTLTYKITVGNTGTGWANGILVEDAINTIKADIGGVPSQAFQSWTVSAIKMAGSGEVVLGTKKLGAAAETLPADVNLSQRVSLAPMSGIEFIIVAKLNQGTTSDIKNTASYKYDPTNPTNPTIGKDSNEVITTKQATNLTIVKKQNNIRENSGFTENPLKYYLSDMIQYQIVVTNGNTATNSFVIKDNIKDIEVGGSGTNPLKAYSEWQIEKIEYSAGSAVTTVIPAIGSIQTQPSGVNIEITSGLKANETVTVTI
ncbi:MAG: hypothetical protein ACRCZ9_12950, partial [Fusobacteriaceae bacterium]